MSGVNHIRGILLLYLLTFKGTTGKIIELISFNLMISIDVKKWTYMQIISIFKSKTNYIWETLNNHVLAHITFNT